MCALVPPCFPNLGWPSSYEIKKPFLDFPVNPYPAESHENDDQVMMTKKKQNHNANERERRKKINAMFSSLRSCLPPSYHQSKKLSFSATVTQALKYIPELQDQVQNLIKKKQQLLLQISAQRNLDFIDNNNKFKARFARYASTISTTRLGDTQVMVQISSLNTQKCSFGNMLCGIEEDGLVLVDVSSSRSQGERLFYTLHLEMILYKMRCQELSDRLLYLYEKCGNLFI